MPSHESKRDRIEAVLVGAGPVGLVTALGLAQAGLPVAACGPPWTPAAAARETRTAAIFGSGITLLRNLSVWEAVAAASEPIHGIRLIDDTGSLLRAPEVLFQAAEIGPEPFGFNIPNAALMTALEAEVARTTGIERIATIAVTNVQPDRDEVRLHLRDGRRLIARLAVGADGRDSLARAAAGIKAERRNLDQAAIACRFGHTRAHAGICTELHRRAGPFTTVPLPGLASSLVWVETKPEIERLMRLADADFLHNLEHRLDGLLGRIETLGRRSSFPLNGLRAAPIAQRRIALVGEAAHVLPPIGAQGLNLGLRDAAELQECVADAMAQGSDIGGNEVLAAYDTARRGDITLRTAGIDLLNRSLITDLLPVHLARGFGLHLLNAIQPLRHWVMREGVQPSVRLPRLMQPPGKPA